MNTAAPAQLRNSDYTHITVTPLAGALGAEIGGVDLARLDDAAFTEIHRAWLDHQVIYFRDQTLTPDEHLGFARRWGDIHIHPFNAPMEGYPEILQLLKTETATRNNGNRWHSDQMYTAEPAKATILMAREMPPFGGDTMFSNLYLAYEALSDGMKARLGGHAAANSFRHMWKSKAEDFGKRRMLSDDELSAYPADAIHPIVRTHPVTGRKCLYVCDGYTHAVEGLDRAESDDLLAYLFAHIVKPDFRYSHEWRVGDLLIWDNCAVQHKARFDYPPELRRRMQRCTIEGTVPF